MFSCLSVPTAARPTPLTGVHFLTSQACFSMFLYEVACCCLVEFAFFWNMLPIRFWDRAVQPTRCVHAAGERTTQHQLLGTDRHHLLCKNKTLLAHPFECTRRVFRSPYLRLVPFKGTERPFWVRSFCFSRKGEAFSPLQHTSVPAAKTCLPVPSK